MWAESWPGAQQGLADAWCSAPTAVGRRVVKRADWDLTVGLAALKREGGVPSRLIKTDRLMAGKEGTPMTNVRTLPVGEGNEEITIALDELAREGARRMIAAALRAEADEYVERFGDERRRGRASARGPQRSRAGAEGDDRVRARSRSARRA